MGEREGPGHDRDWHDELRAYFERPLDHDRLRAWLRECLRRQIAEHDAGKGDDHASDPVLRALGRIQANLLKSVKDSGWLGLLLWPVTFMRARFGQWRVHLAAALRSSVVAVEEATTLFVGAALVVVTIASSPFAQALATTPSTASQHVAGAVVAQNFTQPTRARSAVVGVRVLQVEASDSALAPADPIHAKAGIGHDNRRIHVTRWINAWIPGRTVGSEGEGVWISCDPDSVVLTTTCAAYDQLPEGPWSN